MRLRVLLCIFALGTSAEADLLSWARAAPQDSLRLTEADAFVAPGAVLLWAGTLALPGPSSCRLCDSSLDGIDSWVHDALTGAIFSRGTANTISDVVAYGLVPTLAVGSAFVFDGPHASRGAGLRTAVVLVEGLSIAGFATEVLKLGFARSRPFVRYGHVDATGIYSNGSADSREGFPSGHTSSVAALSFGAATCATLQDSDAAPAMWAAAGALVFATGALRIMAEKHYFTDTLAGAAIGSAAGIAVPLLHRRGATVSPAGISVRF